MIRKDAVFGASETGNVKTENQDRFLIMVAEDCQAPSLVLLAVSDGMGGERGGSRAATLALETLAGAFAGFAAPGLRDQDGKKVLAARLRQAAGAAHEAVCREAGRSPKLRHMGATLTALAACGPHAVFCHVGDSRLYRLRDRRLKRLSRDHRFLEELVAAGDMSREEAKRHPLRHHLDMALGAPGCEPDGGFLETRPGDRLLLCTDGLTDELAEAELEAALSLDLPPRATVARLMEAALRLGGRDNVTALLADVSRS